MWLFQDLDPSPETATYVLPAMQTIRGNQATTKDEQARCNNLEACKERKSKLERRYDTGG